MGAWGNQGHGLFLLPRPSAGRPRARRCWAPSRCPGAVRVPRAGEVSELTRGRVAHPDLPPSPHTVAGQSRSLSEGRAGGSAEG